MKIHNPGYGLASRDPYVERRYKQQTDELLDAGYCSLGAFLDALYPRYYRSIRRPQQCLDVKAEMAACGFYDFRVEPEIWTNQIAELIDQAVMGGRLQLYAWPATIDEDGQYDISVPPQNPKLIDANVLKMVRADHGGLPATFLGLRPAAVAKLEKLTVKVPNCNDLVVVKLEQAVQFVETERKKGTWPTQLVDGRELKAPGRGRPRARKKLVNAIRTVADTNQWDGSKSIPQLIEVLHQQTGETNLSADTVRRAVDDAYALTADERLHRTFGRRNRSNSAWSQV